MPFTSWALAIFCISPLCARRYRGRTSSWLKKAAVDRAVPGDVHVVQPQPPVALHPREAVADVDFAGTEDLTSVPLSSIPHSYRSRIS
eukprot:CAMPEP_0172190416 /NCGR_PEP_ID=MMETSP1050-20130122/23104_1 /TAXON_ID=233186 /ORGANISM="Cryptomonas curvata, Strain CCAP979/52" /LENGTH=87 /DNA_ID=CAMNT_0012865293 /DNA_START=179 /DNA_END=443 /DNA_ORIENTATION=+